MKFRHLLVLLAVTISLQAGKVKLMETAEATDEIPRDSGKATVVFHSNTNFHLMKMVHDYFVDGMFVGQDKKNAWFITKVDPGTHFIFYTIKEKVYNKGKFNLEAGKIYYILRKTVPGGSIMFTQTPEDFKTYLKEVETTFYTLKNDIKPPELDEDDIKEAMEEFEEEAKEDPERHKDVLEYKGF